ncbi:MAG: hypothetical protein UX94_C0005G0063 [Parcubacteria group bacterium GW2011_GWA2_47_21]|nr:MAG: hypothetical protein UX94_C0005G0063 [Parcubacteria group bacterium GW2011_GWA2_47_21]
MRLFEKKNNFKKISHSPVFIILAIIVAVFLVQTAYSAYQKSAESKALLQGVASRRDALSARRDFIQAALGRLQTPAGVEEEIRGKFGMEKEGERTVVIVNDDDGGSLYGKGESENLWDKFKKILGI